MPTPAAPQRPAGAKPPEAAPRRGGLHRGLIGLAAARAGQIAVRRSRRLMQLALGGLLGRLRGTQCLQASEPLPARESGAPYDILRLPIIEWGYRFQRPQQLSREFARRGHRVFYCSHEFLMFGRAAVRRIEENIFGVRIRGNAGLDFYRAAAGPHDGRQMADALAALPLAAGEKETLLIVEHPFWTALAEELRHRHGWRIVYDCMDELSAFSRRRNAAVQAEPHLLAAADLVVASSELLLRKAAAAARRVALVRNGVDYEHFAGVPPAPPATSPVVGYYGKISRRVDAQLVAALARLRPAWRFQLVGETLGAELGSLGKLPNVELLGERPYGELPGYLSGWNCCIIPFMLTPLTEAANPVKAYEMLAAGRPIVGVALPELQPLAQQGLLSIAHDAQGFASEIERLLATDSPGEIACRRAFARQNTWAVRCAEFSAVVKGMD